MRPRDYQTGVDSPKVEALHLDAVEVGQGHRSPAHREEKMNSPLSRSRSSLGRQPLSRCAPYPHSWIAGEERLQQTEAQINQAIHWRPYDTEE
jgi:hypothetical protein